MAPSPAGYEAAFSLLGDLFLGPPTAASAARLAAADPFRDWPIEPRTAAGEAGLGIMRSETRALAPSRLRELERDYLRLFEGPGRPLAPPYESVHLGTEGLLFDALTLDVREQYARWGLEVARKGRVPDDHIAHELHFAAHLAGAAAAALGAGDEGRAKKALAGLEGFLSRHLGRWAPAFAARAAAGARTGFYRGTALLLGDAVASLAAFLADEL